MKTHTRVKERAPAKVNGQQIVYELKHKVVTALNKLADRDTYQIGVNELEKTAEFLSPDMIFPFLSCILEMDSEQKSAVRKECVRLMGTLARFHEGLLIPHLGKIVGSIVKRLKDADTVVRDACVETVGVLSSKLCNHLDHSGVFVSLVKPIFEALGEQNRQGQSGSALCLASIIDNTRDPPASILQQMLMRTTKLLKNPHFMAKPAIIDLNKSIILARGASNQNSLSVAITGIQEALKNTDWTTRKAASVALSEIAATNDLFLTYFKSSCISCLESCRFDKVKPVRDSVLHALQCWRNLQGPDTPELSESEFLIKATLFEDFLVLDFFSKNFYGGDFIDLTSTNESGKKDISTRKVDIGYLKERTPIDIRKTCHNFVEKLHHSQSGDWNIEITLPKTQTVLFVDSLTEESEGSCIMKTSVRENVDATSIHDISLDSATYDKQDCSSASNAVYDSFEAGSVTVSQECVKKSHLLKGVIGNKQFVDEEINSQENTYSTKVKDRSSLDSTLSECSYPQTEGCCSHFGKEMLGIRKQLLEIENKQSNLMDLIQVFNSNVMGSLSTMQSRLSDIENVVDILSQDLLHGSKYVGLSTTKYAKLSQDLSSPRQSTCTPRPSADIGSTRSSLLAKSSTTWDEDVVGHSRIRNADRQSTNMWTNSKLCNNSSFNFQKYSGRGSQNIGCHQLQKADNSSSASSRATTKGNVSDNKYNVWQRVKSFLFQGNLDSAYMEAISSEDELILFELLDRTGPVLESLSSKTVSEILRIVTLFLHDQRFTNSVIPWLRQVADLSTTHGASFVVPSAKLRQSLLSAIQEFSRFEVSNPAERCITQLAIRLQQLWGKCS